MKYCIDLSYCLLAGLTCSHKTRNVLFCLVKVNSCWPSEGSHKAHVDLWKWVWPSWFGLCMTFVYMTMCCAFIMVLRFLSHALSGNKYSSFSELHKIHYLKIKLHVSKLKYLYKYLFILGFVCHMSRRLWVWTAYGMKQWQASYVGCSAWVETQPVSYNLLLLISQQIYTIASVSVCEDNTLLVQSVTSRLSLVWCHLTKGWHPTMCTFKGSKFKHCKCLLVWISSRNLVLQPLGGFSTSTLSWVFRGGQLA